MKYIRKITAYTMAGLIGVSACSQPFTAFAQGWNWTGAYYQTVDGAAIPGAIARGIDTSYWQQNIDWNRVAADDVRFAMLATRFRGDVDPFFRINAEAAHSVGIQLGAYIYSYATSVEMAEQEADFVLNLIKDYPISYPVVFDAEDANTLGTLSPSEVSDVINAFCRKIEAAGYHPMVYANEYWLKNKIDMSKMGYDVWVARYNQLHTYENAAMWQATNTGSIDGISGNVDINFLYKDFSGVIPANTWRNIGGNTYYYQNHLMQKSAWVHDGQGWYYMNEAGNPSKGWMTFPEGKYYLDETTGKMATDWKQFGGVWNYFDPSGTLATGWREVSGNWYYMNGEGAMQTGWQDINGARYYLDDSGAMRTGWADLNGARYLFGQSGAMKTGWQQPDGSWYYLGGDGKMQTGWQQLDGVWYYLNEAGAMQTGWLNLNGIWYYLGGDGKMQIGWQDINGARYYLDGSGAMRTGWLELNGAKYYFAESGALVVNSVLESDGVQYQAGADGVCVVIEQPAPEEPAPEQPVPEQLGPGQPG